MRTKFGAEKDPAKRMADGMVFGSKMEMRYYLEVVKPGCACGQIQHFEVQKPFELQPKYRRAGKAVRSIVYLADFYIEYADGRTVVIDTKGYPDSTALIKRKMFWYKYPDIDYRWVTFYKKYGGWVDYDQAKKQIARDKRALIEKEKV